MQFLVIILCTVLISTFVISVLLSILQSSGLYLKLVSISFAVTSCLLSRVDVVDVLLLLFILVVVIIV